MLGKMGLSMGIMVPGQWCFISRLDVVHLAQINCDILADW